MKINALLDLNVVAHEAADEVALLLEVEAPPAVSDADRPQASLQVVLDRSGSMAGRPIEGAKQALIALVRRLEPTDNFGVVTFDDTAEVVVPAGPLSDKEAVIRRISSIGTGGMTDLSAGYLRGLREIRRAISASRGQGGTVLVVSDGHVNSGVKNPDEFGALTAKAYTDGIVTSTLGYGRGYDETLLAAIARSGSGNHVYAADPDAAGAAIAGEVDGLLGKVVQALSLTVRCEPEVEFLRLYNDLPSQQIGPSQVMIELGDLYGEESRKLLLKLQVPALADLGLAQVATLELSYVELPGLVEHVMTVPISVNVVPGDEAAGRVPDPTVVSEVLFQEAQDVKRRASEAFEVGEHDEGMRLIDETKLRLGSSLAAAPEGLRAEIESELDEVSKMQVLGSVDGSASAPLLSKISRMSYHESNRKRGRRRPSDSDET